MQRLYNFHQVRLAAIGARDHLICALVEGGAVLSHYDDAVALQHDDTACDDDSDSCNYSESAAHILDTAPSNSCNSLLPMNILTCIPSREQVPPGGKRSICRGNTCP